MVDKIQNTFLRFLSKDGANMLSQASVPRALHILNQIGDENPDLDVFTERALKCISKMAYTVSSSIVGTARGMQRSRRVASAMAQCRRRGRFWCAVATLVAAAWAAAALRLSREAVARELFRGVAPHAVAHLAADWSTHPRAGVGAWAVVRERANYSAWEYAVRYECGARCEGHAEVRAHEVTGATAPRHGHADAHRVTITQTECTQLLLLPWPLFCGKQINRGYNKMPSEISKTFLFSTFKFLKLL